MGRSDLTTIGQPNPTVLDYQGFIETKIGRVAKSSISSSLVRRMISTLSPGKRVYTEKRRASFSVRGLREGRVDVPDRDWEIFHQVVND
jgi:hypothetical protein